MKHQRSSAPKPNKLWQVILPLSLGTSLSLFGDTALYTVLPAHTADAGVLLASVGILLSANRFIRLFLNSPIGWLADQWPRRRVFVPSLFVGAISTGLYGWTSGFELMLAGRFLWGLAWSGIWIAGNAIILDVAGPQNRGRLVGVYNAAFFVGAAFGSAMAGLLTDFLGFHQTFQIGAAVQAFGAILAMVMLPETRNRRPYESIAHLNRTTKAAAAVLSDLPITRLASAMGLLGMNRVVIAGMLVPTFSLLMLDSIGAQVTILDSVVGSSTLTGFALSASTIVSMASAPVAGTLSDRWRDRWRVASLGLFIGTIGFLMLTLEAVWAIFFGLLLTAAASGSNQGLSTVLVGELSPASRRGSLMGVHFTVGDLTSAVGPLLAFQIIAVRGIRHVYWVAAALSAVMLLVAIRWTLERWKPSRKTGEIVR